MQIIINKPHYFKLRTHYSFHEVETANLTIVGTK